MRASAIFAISLLCMPLAGQTRVDLRSQSKNIDFSQAQSVRPFRTGTALPAACVTGEMFFKTDAAPGGNVFGCAATNTWILQGGVDPVTDFESNLDIAADRLTISCRTGSCNVQEGEAITPFSGLQASFIPGAGSYTAYIYLENQTLRYGYATGSMTVCGTSCVEGVTAFPPDAIPLFTVAVSNGMFQNGSLTDMRSRYRAPKRAIAGPNIVLTETTDSVIYTVPAGPLRNQPSGVRPACSATMRGTFWHVNGADGAKDSVAVCAKDASDTYSWRTIY